MVSINGKATLYEKWSEMQKRLHPLSLVLFRGTGIISDLIVDLEVDENSKKKALHFGSWSHAGCLVNTDVMDIKNGKPNTWYVYEMTMTGPLAGDNTPNVETGNYKFGTQIRELSLVLKTYPGNICIVDLTDNPTICKTNETESEYQNRMAEIKQKATYFKTRHNNTWYQLNILQLLASVFPYLRWIRSFCPISKYWAMCRYVISQISTDNVLAMWLLFFIKHWVFLDQTWKLPTFYRKILSRMQIIKLNLMFFNYL